MDQNDLPKCDLCDDAEIPKILKLHAKCHLTAPLQASLVGDVLTLRCYVPECSRQVVRLKIEKILPDA